MNTSKTINLPFINSVLHPTNFSKESENAFAHALTIALLRKTKLTILHVSESNDEWTNFPSVRDTLERWDLLEKNSSQADVYNKLAIKVEKVTISFKNNPVNAIEDYIKTHPTDLVVLATEGRKGLTRWLRPSIAERIKERTKTMTLFVHGEEDGFVSLKEGELNLHRILIPIDFHPNPIASIEYAVRAAALMVDPVKIILLHVSDSSEMPAIEIPETRFCTWERVQKRGNVVEIIIEIAREYDINLIIMATAGHEGFLDALRGSITEQVLRKVSCPVLAVPVDTK